MNRQLEVEKRGRRSAGDAREGLLGAAGGSVVGTNLTPELLEFERERLARFLAQDRPPRATERPPG